MSKCNSESMKYSGMKLISRATPAWGGGVVENVDVIITSVEIWRICEGESV